MYRWLSLNSSADLSELTTYVTSEYNPQEVADRLADGLSDAVKGVLIEENYVDKDYRSTFYNFYAKKGQRYRPDCVRLHFFDETVSFEADTLRLECQDNRPDHHYFGYMVLRPTGIATIGRSVVSPDVRRGARGLIISADHKVHLLGYRLRVQGFPSMDQHSDISVCAHAACWSILRHYSERYTLYREFHTYDITLMAQEFDPGGLVPSKGLHLSHAERVFQEAGTFPVHITRSDANDASFYRQMCAYVESCFPLFAAMHGEGHAIAVIGLEWRQTALAGASGPHYAWDKIESLTVIDDNELPYLSVPVHKGGSIYAAEDIDAFIVPLPEKVFYPADAVERLAPTLSQLGSFVGLPPEDETIIRYFITTGSALRSFMRDRESEYDPKLMEIVMLLPFAQFVWVVEFATEAEWVVGQISARAVIDATASLHERFPFWLFHSRSQALVFDRQKVGDEASGIGAMALSGMDHTAFTRMDQNLRPIITK